MANALLRRVGASASGWRGAGDRDTGGAPSSATARGGGGGEEDEDEEEEKDGEYDDCDDCGGRNAGAAVAAGATALLPFTTAAATGAGDGASTFMDPLRCRGGSAGLIDGADAKSDAAAGVATNAAPSVELLAVLVSAVPGSDDPRFRLNGVLNFAIDPTLAFSIEMLLRRLREAADATLPTFPATTFAEDQVRFATVIFPSLGSEGGISSSPSQSKLSSSLLYSKLSSSSSEEVVKRSSRSDECSSESVTSSAAASATSLLFLVTPM